MKIKQLAFASLVILLGSGFPFNHPARADENVSDQADSTVVWVTQRACAFTLWVPALAQLCETVVEADHGE